MLSSSTWFIIQSGSPTCNGFLRSMRDQVSHAKNKASKNYRATDTMRWSKNIRRSDALQSREFSSIFVLTSHSALKIKQQQQTFHSLISQNHTLKALKWGKNFKRFNSINVFFLLLLSSSHRNFILFENYC